jgi:ABC-type nickel/cobalt efflux system permease component RcnA
MGINGVTYIAVGIFIAGFSYFITFTNQKISPRKFILFFITAGVFVGIGLFRIIANKIKENKEKNENKQSQPHYQAQHPQHAHHSHPTGQNASHNAGQHNAGQGGSVKYCTNCGSALRHFDRFCYKCGNRSFR